MTARWIKRRIFADIPSHKVLIFTAKMKKLLPAIVPTAAKWRIFMKTRGLLLLLLVISLGLALASCGPDPTYYTVTFDSNGGTEVQSVAVEDGSTVSEPTAPEWAGYTFLGWYFGDELWDFENNTVTEDITVKAKWQRITYKVSFNSDGGTNISTQVIGVGDYASKPKDPIKDGCVFKGWFSGATAWNFETMPIEADTVLTAKWEKISYTVTFDSDGGNKIDSQSVEHGESAVAPINPTKQNHEFIGWYFGDLLWDFENNKITSDITLTAKWESAIVTHEVKFMLSETEVYQTRHTVNGEKLEAPTHPTKQDHRFLGWYLGETPWDFENNTVTSAVTLIAKWETAETHKVKFMVSDTEVYETHHVVDGEKATAPTNPTKQDCAFRGWHLGETPWSFENDTVSADITLVAKWQPANTHEVKFMVSESQIYKTDYVANGEKVSAPADEPTKQDHKFLGWYLGSTKFDFDNYVITEPIQLTAKWESTIVTHAVKFMVSEGKLYHTSHVVDGETLEAPIPPPSKTQVFLGWYLGEEKFDFENHVITKPIQLTAKWGARKAFVITFNTDGGTAVDPQYIIAGNPITEPNTEKAHHKLKYWTYNGVVWDFSTEPTSNMELVAVWELEYPIVPV